MKQTNKNINILGTTRSGKYIYKEPSINEQFTKQDHLDAYCAHAKFLMHNQLLHTQLDSHKKAMNEHYLKAVNS